ncbi:hypothetical protein M885DRAFT_499337 [Pelagophyceae sp. CCMP2097]|nr:hypothetical protein M885DRAFT_499337 [Pelagophyceae sp. CCMP2097]
MLGKVRAVGAQVPTSIWSPLWKIAFYVAFGLATGLATFLYLAIYFPKQKRDKGGEGGEEGEEPGEVLNGWPVIGALSLVTFILGGFVTYLLVFRLSWAFCRWWDAGGFLDAIQSNLKVICLNTIINKKVNLPHDEARFAALRLSCESFFDAVVDALSRGGDSAASQNISAAATVDGDRHGGLSRRETAKGIAFVCHAKIALCINACQEGHSATGESLPPKDICGEHAQLMRDYDRAHMIKTTPVPLPLHLLVKVIKVAYVCFVFPQTMAYVWVMNLTQEELELKICLEPILVFSYIFVIAVGIAFLEALHLIAVELDDPYGDDVSDLPMKQMADALRADLDTLAKVERTFSHEREHAAFRRSLTSEPNSPAPVALTMPVPLTKPVEHQAPFEPQTPVALQVEPAASWSLHRAASELFAARAYDSGRATDAPAALEMDTVEVLC